MTEKLLLLEAAGLSSTKQESQNSDVESLTLTNIGT